MPLVSDRQSKPLSHSNSRAIGFWMSVEGRAPIQAVRVLVSYEALSELDPTNVRDLHGALENFDRFRSQVEPAASRKFDRCGFDGQKYEGMPAIRLTTDDLIETELGGPTMFARIGVMQALNRGQVREFTPSSKGHHWGRKKL